jgi:hypothetical protein
MSFVVAAVLVVDPHEGNDRITSNECNQISCRVHGAGCG